MDIFPTYEPNAEAHIHPALQLRLPKVSERALALVNGDSALLAGAPEIIVNQPIEFTAPKDEYQRWFATGEEQFFTVCTSIRLFIERWVLPFFSQVSKPADLVKIYETKNERMMKQKHWYIFVAGAYDILNERAKAAEVIQTHFGSAGLRRRYSSLFIPPKFS